MQQVVKTIQKNSNEHIQVELTEFKGHDLLGMRVWAQTDAGLVPTKKGLTVSVRLIPELLAALTAARDAAAKAGLLTS